MKWGHLQTNPARGVDLPTLEDGQAEVGTDDRRKRRRCSKRCRHSAKTMAGLAMLTGLRRGELFALRWKDLDLDERSLTVHEAVYEGIFGTPKTEAGLRRVPLVRRGHELIGRGNERAKRSNRRRWCSRRGPANRFRRTTCCSTIVPRVRSARAAERLVAHVPTNVLVVGAREGRPRQGGGDN